MGIRRYALGSQLFSKVRLHIDTGAPNGVAFQRVLLCDIALFGKQRPDGVYACLLYTSDAADEL